MAAMWMMERLDGKRAVKISGGNSGMEVRVKVVKNGSPARFVKVKLDDSGQFVLVLRPGAYVLTVTEPQVAATSLQPLTTTFLTSEQAPQSVKSAPIVEAGVDAGPGKITVEGHGNQGEKVTVELIPKGSQTLPQGTSPVSFTLPNTMTQSHTFTGLAPGKYDVQVTAPDPGGTVYTFQDVEVT